MSQFDRYTVTEYVEAMRSFLGLNKRTFLKDFGFVQEGDDRKGRLKRESYGKNGVASEAVQAIEAMVNAKANRCEASDTTLGERYKLARDYLGYTDAYVAKLMGVSRELVRRWGADIHRPSNIAELAKELQVPVDWLAEGGEENLPANSHLGVRVGEEALLWREQLYGLTQAVVADIPDDQDEAYAQATIEWAVYNHFELARAARRAGGRWQVVSNTLLFAPWIPIPEHGLSKRYWSGQVPRPEGRGL